MKSLFKIFCVFCVFCGLMLPVRASDAVEPASITITNFRDEVIGNISAVEYYNGSSLQMNFVLYAGASTNSARQGLSNVVVEVKIGNTSTAETWTATNTSTNGECSIQIIVPTFPGNTYVQVKPSDINTNNYIYPWKILNRKTAL